MVRVGVRRFMYDVDRPAVFKRDVMGNWEISVRGYGGLPVTRLTITSRSSFKIADLFLVIYKLLDSTRDHIHHQFETIYRHLSARIR